MDNHGNEVLFMLLSNIKIALATFLKGFLAVALIVLMDSAALITTTYIMIGLHVSSGYVLMWKSGTSWDKDKWFKTCMKIGWFPAVIVATKMLKETHGLSAPIGIIVSGFLCVNEIKGFLDNVGRLTGIDIWNAIKDQIDWKKFKIKDKKEDAKH